MEARYVAAEMAGMQQAGILYSVDYKNH